MTTKQINRMPNYNRNQLGAYKNADQEWSEELKRRRASNRESEPVADPDPNDPSSQKAGRNERTGYYGSPYDVGNYASHYDQGYNPGEQRLGPERAPSGKPDHSGKGPRAYQRSDKRILEDVSDRLYLDPYIDASDIEVQVDKCDVVLTGTVEDRNAKRRAEDIAESTPGVKNVENRLRIAKTHTAGPVRSNAREALM